MSLDPSAVAVFKANAYSKNGACADEANDVKEAAQHYAQAALACDSAKVNAFGAGVVTLGASATAFGCLAFGPEPIGILCIVGAGFGILGSTLWTESGVEAYYLAQDQLDEAEEALEHAIKKFCQCLHEHS